MQNADDFIESEINKLLAEKFKQARKNNPDLPLPPADIVVIDSEGNVTAIDNRGVLNEIKKQCH